MPDEDDGQFEDAMDDLGAKRGRRGERVADKRRRVRPRSPAVEFQSPDPGEPLLGVAEGVNAAQLRRLRAGRVRPEAVVDLHEMRAETARREFHAELQAAAAQRLRCVLVIHGKGLHSHDGPVLKERLRGWLGEPGTGAHVLAFAPAVAKDGGSGATYVLLRK